MNFSQLWILRRLALIIFFLMMNIIFNCGVTSCRSSYLHSERKSSEEQNFLIDYLNFALNKSKELEEVIYSDILNNLRTLVRLQNKKSEHTNEYDNNGGSVKTEKSEFNKENRTGELDHPHAAAYDVFLSIKDDKGRGESTFGNFTPGISKGFPRDSYLLGYSGDPFGSQKLIAGDTKTHEYIQDEGVIVDPRKKRSVLHLYNMVLCSTGCNPFAYKGYGCYCGFLGSGYVVDGIDSCCKMHDWCYNSAGCPMFLEYFIPYFWKCYHHQPLCAIDHGYYGGGLGSCSQRLCECDRQLALCLRRHPCPTTKALCTSSPLRLLQNILML